MDDKFFSSWDWWQKLIFILACSIVFIITVGCIAFSIAKHRTSSYATLGTKIGTTSENYSTEDPEMSLGIKTVDGQALNQGEHDYSSRIPSFTIPAMSKHSFSSRYEDLILNSSDNGEFGSKSNTQYYRLNRNPELQIGRAISTDVVEESINVARPSTPKSHCSRSTRSQSFRALHVLDEKDESYEACQSEVDDRESLPSAHMFQTLRKETRSEASSDTSFTTQLASNHTNFKYQTTEADLSLLHSHRLSHVAETGQLTPRGRRRLGKSLSSNTSSSIGTESVHSNNSYPNAACVSAEDSHLAASGSPSEFSKSSDSITLRGNDTHSSHIEPTHAKMYSLPHISVSDMEVIDLGKVNTAEKTTPIQKDKLPIDGRKVNSGFEVLAKGTFARQQSRHGSEREKKHHKKQHQNKSSPDLNNKLLRKLRKSVSNRFS